MSRENHSTTTTPPSRSISSRGRGGGDYHSVYHGQPLECLTSLNKMSASHKHSSWWYHRCPGEWWETRRLLDKCIHRHTLYLHRNNKKHLHTWPETSILYMVYTKVNILSIKIFSTHPHTRSLLISSSLSSASSSTLADYVVLSLCLFSSLTRWRCLVKWEQEKQ